MQKWRGRPGPFYHMNDVIVYLGRHREGGWGRGPPSKEYTCVLCLNQEQYVFCFANVQNSSPWGRNCKIRPQAIWCMLGTGLYLNLIHSFMCDIHVPPMQLTTGQGRGRALIRLCLCEHLLADCVQNSISNTKRTKYVTLYTALALFPGSIWQGLGTRLIQSWVGSKQYFDCVIPFEAL